MERKERKLPNGKGIEKGCEARASRNVTGRLRDRSHVLFYVADKT